MPIILLIRLEDGISGEGYRTPCLAPFGHSRSCQDNRAIDLEKLVTNTNFLKDTD